MFPKINLTRVQNLKNTITSTDILQAAQNHAAPETPKDYFGLTQDQADNLFITTDTLQQAREGLDNFLHTGHPYWHTVSL